MANISVQNLTTSILSTEVGSLLPGETKSVPMGPLQAYRAADSLKAMQDAGKIQVTVTEESSKLDAMELGPTVVSQIDVTIPTAAVLTLNATPVQIVPAPGAGFCVIFEGAVLSMKYNSIAYNGVAAGEDLVFSYTNGAGVKVALVESTGFVDQTTNQMRYARPYGALITTDSSMIPTAGAALMLSNLSGEWATGNSDLKVRCFFRIVPATLG